MNIVNIDNILQNLGIEKLNPMQNQSLDLIRSQTEIVLLSPTGTGKTLAFLLPLFTLLDPQIKGVQALVIVPSRELGLQIEKVWKAMATGFKVNICYGGHSVESEINDLSTPPSLLIGTPNRLIDHLQRGSFSPETIKTLVLDEFDKLLQQGFDEQISDIYINLNKLEKKILASATANIEIPEFLEFQEPKRINYCQEKLDDGALSLWQINSTQKEDKIKSLFQLICSLNSESALIFCNFREDTEKIYDFLSYKGIKVALYQGGMEQEDRERALTFFRNGSIRYLVATDLAARGLDIPQVRHIIHYQLPSHLEEFTHRNGRTARMNNTGNAYILSSADARIPDYLPKEINKYELNPQKYGHLPLEPDYITLYISGGKKNKINKIDIVGFFCQQGGLEKQDLGLIEVKDFKSFVAVQRDAIPSLLRKIKEVKMKGKKYKIEIARN